MTTFPTDDLASVLIAPDREFAGYGMGILRAFDRRTFDNTVEYHGALLHDLTVKDRIGGLTYRAGDVVLLTKWRLTGSGLASIWIDSAPVVPGAGRGEEAVEFLRGELAKQISAQVFAARVHTAEVAALEVTTDDVFTDLDTVGPQIQDVEITAGVAVVMLSASGSVTAPAGAGSETQYMGVAVSGASSVAANIKDSYALQVVNHNSNGTNHTIGAKAGIGVVIPDLNPGLHMFTAKYRVGASGGGASFHDRTMVVIGL